MVGPDGVIYVALPEQAALGAITMPNIHGAGCAYRSSAVPLPGTVSLIGLPNMISGYTMKPLTVDGPLTLCRPDTAVLYRSHGGWCSRGRCAARRSSRGSRASSTVAIRPSRPLRASRRSDSHREPSSRSNQPNGWLFVEPAALTVTAIVRTI